VCSFHCEGASPEIPEIFPEIPDFPETPEKSPEYLGFTDKFVLSGDFQDSPIHPPPSRRHQDPFSLSGYDSARSFLMTALGFSNGTTATSEAGEDADMTRTEGSKTIGMIKKKKQSSRRIGRSKSLLVVLVGGGAFCSGTTGRWRWWAPLLSILAIAEV
jgi:hypothetical protein